MSTDLDARRNVRLDLPVDGNVCACAVFAHCFAGSTGSGAASRIVRALTREGVAVLQTDFTGLKSCEDDDRASGVELIVEAARHLEEAYGAPALLVGHSRAGSAALIAAGRLPSVAAVAVIGTPFPDDPAAPGGGDRIAGLAQALLIMHAPTDEVAGIDNAARIYRAARHPKSFVSLDGADHGLTRDADAEYAGNVLAAWARRYVDIRFRPDPDLDLHDHRVAVRIGRDQYSTEIRAGGHALIADEPEALGGTSTGPTPYDLLIGGLGACVAITIRMYADRKGWPVDGVEVRLTHRKLPPDEAGVDAGGSRKVDVIDREITLYGDLDETQRARLLEVADRCPVHRTLGGQPLVRTTERRPQTA